VIMKNVRASQKASEGAVQSRFDNVRRSAALEAQINESVYQMFSTPVGAFVLDYLRSVTLQRVSAEGCSEAELRELEGQRRLVAGLMARMKSHETTQEGKNV